MLYDLHQLCTYHFSFPFVNFDDSQVGVANETEQKSL